MRPEVRTARRWLAGVAVCGALGAGGVASAQQPPVVLHPPTPVVAPAGVESLPDTLPAVEPPPALPAAPPAPANPPAPAADDGDVLKKVPTARALQRPGFFPVPPTGPGYYSLFDALTGNYREGPPKYPYPRSAINPSPFFETDWRYLADPNNTDTDVFDPLKRVRIGDNWLFSTGGEVRNRFVGEYNSRLTQHDNNYDLTRVRLYGDLWFRDDFRVFAEFLGAYSNWQDLPPLVTDVDRADFLNLFVDVRPFDLNGKPVYVRVGRQELLFGSQRLISPPDWNNTRRTFQGVRAFRQSEDFDADIFWVQPVIPNPGRLDSVDNNQNFAGAWTTYRLRKGQAVDAYYLLLDNTNDVRQLGIQRGHATLNTFGGRYYGDRDGAFLWDFEGAMQLGSVAGQNVIAGMGTAGLGYHWKDVPLNPTVWAYYDYASGDDDPTGGTVHTFNQLFPFGHYYFGWTDEVGRQNIHDLNFHLYVYPTKWVQCQLQFHNFWLAARRDALYNAFGTAIRRDPTGQAGNFVGNELDAIVNFHLTKHSDLLTGYAYLFGGEFLRNTAGPNAAVNTSVFWAMINYRW